MLAEALEVRPSRRCPARFVSLAGGGARPSGTNPAKNAPPISSRQLRPANYVPPTARGPGKDVRGERRAAACGGLRRGLRRDPGEYIRGESHQQRGTPVMTSGANPTNNAGPR